MSSLNPKKRIIDIISEPIINFENLSEEDTRKRVLELLNIVGMGEESLYKYPLNSLEVNVNVLVLHVLLHVILD